MTTAAYIHGTSAQEQARLSRLNEWMNARCLRELLPRVGERVLDVGCGLGQFTRALARELRRMERIAPPQALPPPSPLPRIVGVERDPAQLAAARKLAEDVRETALVDFRAGDVFALPLQAEERGSFGLVHCRFLLEHLADPAGAVRAMAAAAAPGGRLVLVDEDHETWRMNPDLPEFEAVWRAYIATIAALGNDPTVGRRLTSYLHDAGCKPSRTAGIFFGACAGSVDFELLVDNLATLLAGARDAMLAAGAIDAARFGAGLTALEGWRRRPDAALWYCVWMAEGVKGARA